MARLIDCSSHENIFSDCASDEGISDGKSWKPLGVQGYLSKWTNLLHGWQERYFILSDGLLTYYRNADEMDLGSRGSIHIRNAYVKAHKYDECRFEVRVGDLIWYLRGVTDQDRKNWISSIERHRKIESGYGSERTIHRPSSLLSLNSLHSPSTHSFTTTKWLLKVNETLSELVTFRDYLCGQFEYFLAYFTDNDALIKNKRTEHWLDKYTTATTNAKSSMILSNDASDITSLMTHANLNTQFENHSLSSEVTIDSFNNNHITRNHQAMEKSMAEHSLLEGVSHSRDESISSVHDSTTAYQKGGVHTTNMKSDVDLFKVTSTAMLANLSYSVEMIQQYEDQWCRRLEREYEKRRRAEETQKAMLQELLYLRQLTVANSHFEGGAIKFPCHSRASSYGNNDFNHPSADIITDTVKLSSMNHTSDVFAAYIGPDFAEGPNSQLREEEFYDALDAETDKMEQNEVHLAALKTASEAIRLARAMPMNHPLYAELDRVVRLHIKNFTNTDLFALCNPALPSTDRVIKSTATDGWEILVHDTNMIILKRELESDDGVVLDPLQAIYVIDGVTAREMCTYFWDVRYRMDWEFTVAQVPSVLEVCGDDTLVIYQLYKRVWPTTQRDSLFWSHICPINTCSTNSNKLNHSLSMSSRSKPNFNRLHQRSASTGTNCAQNNDSCNSTVQMSTSCGDALDSWMVVNTSTDYASEKIPPTSSPTIRLGLEVVLHCRTELVTPSAAPVDLATLSRQNIRTRLVYMANINPGGWVPAAGLRSVARREYPRFLKRFSSYVKDQTKGKPLYF